MPCNPVIKEAVDCGALQCFSAVDDHAVISGNDISAHSLKSAGDAVDPVAFFDFQFSGIGDDSGTFGVCCKNSDNRQLVNESRDIRSANGLCREEESSLPADQR